MANFYAVMKENEVVDAKTLAMFYQQRLGTPYPTIQGLILLKKQIKMIFAVYPDADYQTLVKMVEWAKAKGKKYAHCHTLVSHYRYAWRDGYLPELDPNPTREIDALISEAMSKETDEEWLRRLSLSSGLDGRTQVYNEWVKKVNSDI